MPAADENEILSDHDTLLHQPRLCPSAVCYSSSQKRICSPESMTWSAPRATIPGTPAPVAQRVGIEAYIGAEPARSPAKPERQSDAVGHLAQQNKERYTDAVPVCPDSPHDRGLDIEPSRGLRRDQRCASPCRREQGDVHEQVGASGGKSPPDAPQTNALRSTQVRASLVREHSVNLRWHALASSAAPMPVAVDPDY
jgi:hypothetical protein